MSSSSMKNTKEESSRTRISESIFDAISMQASTNPDKTALNHAGRKISYKQVFQRVSAIAEQLQTHSVKKGDRIALLFPNHPEFVTCFFAAAGLAAVVVPVNPQLKADEIAHILHDSQARILIIHESALSEVNACLLKLTESGEGHSLESVLVCTDSTEESREFCKPELFVQQSSNQLCKIEFLTEAAVPSSSKAPEFASEINPEKDLALIVYTSGTTGKPKGAMLSHANLISALKESLFESFEIGASDVFLATLPLCHIYGIGVLIYVNAVKGSSIVIVPRFDPETVLNAISKHKVSILPMVPAMYRFVLMKLAEGNNYDLSSLRFCLCAAAPLSRELALEIETELKVPVYEGYGLSETACGGTVNPYREAKSGSIGKAISCLELMIRSEDGKELPPGPDYVGEIALRGPNIMLGYFNKEEETEEVFDNGWFLTGDLGYKDEEGYVFIVGRKKELIIRGGANIYPREVEEVISKIPGVKDVAVIGVPDKLMGERVKACIVAVHGSSLDEEKVKRYCAEHLAHYKVPRLVEFLDALPRNSTGKILKRELH